MQRVMLLVNVRQYCSLKIKQKITTLLTKQVHKLKFVPPYTESVVINAATIQAALGPFQYYRFDSPLAS